MSLTKKDLNQIRQLMIETTKPQFDNIDKRFDEVDKRFDEVDKRFDEVDKRFERVESRLDNMESRLTGVENKVESIENRLTAAFKEIVNDIYDLSPSRDEFNIFERRVTHIEHKIN